MAEHIEIPQWDEEQYDLPMTMRVNCAVTVKAINKAEKEVAHLITTANPDRVGDIVDSAGADLSNYLKHPVVMADHGYGGHYTLDRIIGRAMSLTVDDGQIFARTKYRDTPLGQDAFNLVAEGLGAWSIGFRPLSFKAIRDDKGVTKGFHHTKWELLEYSQVAVPMNGDVVRNAVQRGLVREENIPILFKAQPPAPTAPTQDGPIEANAGVVVEFRKPLPRLTERDRRVLATLNTIIAGAQVSRETARLGE